jgi:hypothetical protein
MDIDLAVDLADLPKMCQAIAEDSADLLIASRFLPGASRSRKLIREIVPVTVYNPRQIPL